jgi:hypothetical protein
MPRLSIALNPASYVRFFKNQFTQRLLRLRPNLRGATYYKPGHFHSPLLDIQSLGENDSNLPFDGEDWWQHIDLQPEKQRAYYQDLLDRFPLLPFPAQRADGYRYYTDNNWFPLSDAFTLSGIIRREKPRRIIEVGSGFSSAVVLDTLEHTHAAASLTFIEPFPQRLYSLLSSNDKSSQKVVVQRIQEVNLSVFDELDSQDVLFIDSSHVAKVGSDVSFIFLRILPRLKPGVIVHFHDIFYPFSYPAGWIRDGIAWNESLFLRAFLAGNTKFEMMAFNSFAGHRFPELFRERLPAYLDNPGGSIWIRKVG